MAGAAVRAGPAETLPSDLEVDPLERLDELAQVVRGQIGVGDGTSLLLQRGKRVLETCPSMPSTTSPYIWIRRR